MPVPSAGALAEDVAAAGRNEKGLAAGEAGENEEQAWSDVVRRVEELFSSRDNTAGLTEALARDSLGFSGGKARSAWSCTAPFGEPVDFLGDIVSGLRPSPRSGRVRDTPDGTVPAYEELLQGEQLASEPRRDRGPAGPPLRSSSPPAAPAPSPSPPRLHTACRTPSSREGAGGEASSPPRGNGSQNLAPKATPRLAPAQRQRIAESGTQSHAGNPLGTEDEHFARLFGNFSEASGYQRDSSPVPTYMRPTRDSSPTPSYMTPARSSEPVSGSGDAPLSGPETPPGSCARRRQAPKAFICKVLPGSPERGPRGGPRGQFEVASLGLTERDAGTSSAELSERAPERAPEPPDVEAKVAYIDIPRHALKDFKTFARDVADEAKREIAADNPYVKALRRHRVELHTSGLIPDPAEEPSLAQQMSTEREALSLMTPLSTFRAASHDQSGPWPWRAACCVEDSAPPDVYHISTVTPRRAGAAAYLAAEREGWSTDECSRPAGLRTRDRSARRISDVFREGVKV